MRAYRYFLLLSISLILCSLCFSQTKKTLTPQEQSYSKLFTEFLQHAKLRLNELRSFPTISKSSNQSAIDERKNDSLKYFSINKDSADIDYVMKNYFLATDRKNELSVTEGLKMANPEIRDLYEFCDINNFDNLTIKPLRFCNDVHNKYIYSQLNDFQKANTFIFYNIKTPEKLLGYILFIPAKTINSTSPRILSWKLTFCYGRYYFVDIYGQTGTEILWNGVKGPEHPIDIKKRIRSI